MQQTEIKRRVITTKAVRERESEKKAGAGNILRPETFDAYIGQAKVKEQVSLAVRSAAIREASAPHMLFYGPPGLGKTTMAHIIASEESVPIKEISGPSIEKPGDMAAALMGLKPKEIFFIDEIHRIPPACEEILYSAMEDDYLNITIGTGEQQRIVHVKLPEFTLIGATTRAGMLSAPLRDRFSLKCRMEFYTEEELAEIIKASAVKLELDITDSQALMAAKASRGTPRIANSLLERIRDVAVVKNKGTVTDDTVKEALKIAGTDINGLTVSDMKLLAILKEADKPVGLMTLSDMTGEDPGTIEEMQEPYLLKEGYMEKTGRGRLITNKGKAAVSGKPARK